MQVFFLSIYLCFIFLSIYDLVFNRSWRNLQESMSLFLFTVGEIETFLIVFRLLVFRVKNIFIR